MLGNEAQFFQDLVPQVLEELDKEVYVFVLDGDFHSFTILHSFPTFCEQCQQFHRNAACFHNFINNVYNF